MSETIKKRLPFTDCRGSSIAGWNKLGIKPTTLTIATERTKESTTADSDILRALVYSYEHTLEKKKGPKKAIAEFWETVHKAYEKKLLSEEEYEILINASEAGEIASSAYIKPVGIKYIRSVQILVKANPVVLKLPFVRDSMINILRRQKYTSRSSTSLKDAWLNFLHKRPKGKILHSKESLKRLVNLAVESGLKPVDVYYEVGKALGIGEESLKKMTSIAGRRGRPRKKRK